MGVLAPWLSVIILFCSPRWLFGFLIYNVALLLVLSWKPEPVVRQFMSVPLLCGILGIAGEILCVDD